MQIAAVCRNDTIATAIGSFFLLIFINTSGFVLSAATIPPWYLGAFWANPFTYATRALAINEFTSPQWMNPDPSNPSQLLGASILTYRGFPQQYWWTWVSLGFIIVTGLLNLALLIVATTFLGREPR